MLSVKSLEKYTSQYYSELVLITIIFLFFLELISDFIETIYALCLLTLSLNENLISVIFLFSPLVLLFFRKDFPDKLIFIVGGLMIICRVLEALLVKQAKMIVAGLGVGCFLIFFPLFLQQKDPQQEEQSGLTLGLGLTLAVAISILFRTLGSSIDISIYSWFQAIGWVLAGIALFMIIGLFTKERKEKSIESFLETNNQSSDDLASTDQVDSTWSILGFTFGLTCILVMCYFTFSSPTVISRWIEGNYFSMTTVIMLLLTAEVLWVLYKPHRLITERQRVWVFFLINLVFVLLFVVTIFGHQTPIPSSSDTYPLYVPLSSMTETFQTFNLFFILLVIFLDFTLFSRELIKRKPTMHKLGVCFALSSLFFLLMIFGNVFTTTYDYIDVVGPFFREMFWFVFLVIGIGITLPILFVEKSTLTFKKPTISLQTKIISLIIVIISIGTIIGVLVTSPIPTTPETATSIKVLTYNVKQGYSENGIKNFNGQLNLIREVGADIIGLQESDVARISGGNSDIVRYFANHLNLYSYYGPKTVTGTFGIALLSKFPIKNARTFFMPSEGEQTATIEAQIDVGSTSFNVFVTHLGNGGPLEQQETIIDVVSVRNDVILMGDFNFEPSDPQYSLTRAILEDSWLIAGASACVDYVDDLEYNVSERIDHIFVSTGTTVSECHYIVSEESDHPALWAEIEL